MGSKVNTLAVVVSWKRPENIPSVLASLRAQSVECDIAIFDNSPPGYEIGVFADDYDYYFTADKNIGAACRFLPALALPQYKYILFTTDDYAAGPRLLEHYLACAAELGDHFATLGQDGRVVRGNSVVKRRVRMDQYGHRKVDVVTTWELAQARDIVWAYKFRDVISRSYPAVSKDEDDLLLCLGIQWASMRPSYVVRQSPPDGGCRISLPDKGPGGEVVALSARPDHAARRDDFIAAARGVGWESLVNK